MENNWEEGGAVYLTLGNPRLTSSKTKDGAKYKVTFEVLQDEWLEMMDADITGMVLEAKCIVEHSHEAPEKPQEKPSSSGSPSDRPYPELKGGPLSKNAGMLCNDGSFFDYIRDEHNDWLSMMADAESRFKKDLCRQWILDTLEIETLRQLDAGHGMASEYQRLITGPYRRWEDNL